MADTAFIIFCGFCFKWYYFYFSCGLIRGSTTVIYSVHCIHEGTALIFRTLCPWLYEVFSVFRCDCNCFGGGLIYINEYIPSKPLNNHPVFSNLELMAFEPHQRKRKWLPLGIYKLPSQNDIEFLNRVSSIRGCYLGIYENILAMVDFKLSFDKSHLEAFMQAYDFIKKPTCYQSNTQSCTDLILGNRKSFYLMLLELVCRSIINLSALF